jgi:hypothetical protein
MKDVDYMRVAEGSINNIKGGAFLTVKSGNALNTMTIGWATFGVVWSKPIMMVAVRSSRHTFGIIEAAKDFTVTAPEGDMHKETAYCGSKSGRNVDKFKMCNLETTDSHQVASPIIKPAGAITSVKSSTSPPWIRAILTRIMIHPVIQKRITIPFILVKSWLAMKPTDIQTV